MGECFICRVKINNASYYITIPKEIGKLYKLKKNNIIRLQFMEIIQDKKDD